MANPSVFAYTMAGRCRKSRKIQHIRCTVKTAKAILGNQLPAIVSAGQNRHRALLAQTPMAAALTPCTTNTERAGCSAVALTLSILSLSTTRPASYNEST